MSSHDWEMLIRLLLAAFLGGIVGIERGSGDEPAGFRTHIFSLCRCGVIYAGFYAAVMMITLCMGRIPAQSVILPYCCTGSQRYWFSWCRYDNA
ncbi:MAG: MgtC/SapB family protein [Phascolarctobacterium faecium]